MADLILSVDLDPKDAVQTAKDLKKEVNKVMDASRGEAKSPINTAAMEKAKLRIQSLTTKIEEASTKQSDLIKQMEDMQNIEIPSDTYKELINEIQSAETELTKLRESMEWNEETGGEIYFSSEVFEKEAARAEELEDQLIELRAKAEEMQQSGVHLIDPKTTEEYQKLNEKLDAANNKMKLLTLQYQEAAKKASGVSASVQNLSKDTAKVQKAAQLMAGTAGFGGVTKALSMVLKTLKKVAVGIVAVTLGVRGVMSIINKIRAAIKEGFQYLLQGDKDLKKRVDKLKDSFAEVKANLAAAFLPIVEMAIPYIQKLLDWINMLISKIAMFVALIAGQNAYTKAIKKTGDAAASASKQLSKFDELNNLTTNGGGSDWSTEKVAVDPKVMEAFERLKALINEIKELLNKLFVQPFLEGFSAAIGDWQSKLDKIKSSILGIGSALVYIFNNPELIKAMEKFIQSFARFLGSLVGLIANIGLNIAIALLGGIEDFLNSHKDEIQNDLISMFSLGSDIFDNFSQLAIDISSIIDTIGESTSLQQTISNLLGTVYELASAVELVALKLADLVSGGIAQIIHDNVENIKQDLELVFQVLEKVSGFLEMVATTIKNLLLRLVDEVITPIWNALTPIISELIGKLTIIWQKLQPLILWLMENIQALWVEYVDPVLNDILDLASSVAQLIGQILKRFWDQVLSPLIDYIVEWMPLITAIVQGTFNNIFLLIKLLLAALQNVVHVIKDVVDFIVAIVNGDWKGAWEAAKNFFKDMFLEPFHDLLDIFGEYFTNAIDNGLKLLDGLMLGIVATAEFLVNFLIDTVNNFINDVFNNFINAINNLSDKINIPTIPDIPKKNWTNPSIPGLAQGTVIPASMGQFVARLGDNNHETEVVSPLSTIKQALIEALQESGGGGDIHVHVELEGREIAKAMVKQNEVYKKSAGGRSMFA